MTETQFVELLRRRAARLGAGLGGNLRRGIGDDCAVIAPSGASDLLVTTDLFVENVHFRRQWQEPHSAGHRALARGLSDIAAMAGIPRCVFLSLALPGDLKADWIASFLNGFFKLARAARVRLAGGDTGRSGNGFVADVIVLGEVPRRQAILRSGARAGDEIWVTGSLGLAATALGVLERSAVRRQEEQHYAQAMRKFFYPRPRLGIGRFLREHKLASAMIDLSDGLSIDLARLCKESGVGARIVEEAVPRTAQTAVAKALHGGEDLELLFTVPPTRSCALPRVLDGVKLTRIGEIIAAKKTGNLVLMCQGKERPLPVRGFQHF